MNGVLSCLGQVLLVEWGTVLAWTSTAADAVERPVKRASGRLLGDALVLGLERRTSCSSSTVMLLPRLFVRSNAADL
jgi:hypothetical protein